MSEQYLTIKTPVGSLRGRQEQSVLGDNYYGFQSIPYAKPPVGELRFKSPQPVEPWDGVKDAFHVSPIAPAWNMITKTVDSICDEDCLYLNLYIKQRPEEVEHPKAVMVYIHGGGYTNGSGNKTFSGPDFFMIHDIVLVSINYRLGALGFLSLQNELCPGNFGLKDQVLALKWVQENIASFGGDPNNVTIFGVSAGGSSIHYHMLSTKTQGLFHKAIAQSGSALTNWSYAQKPREYAFALGKRLGCDTQDDRVLMESLMKASYEDIATETDGLSFVVEAAEKVGDSVLSFPFTPTVEPDHEDAFLSKHPSELLETGQYHDIPYITGVTTLEGILAIANNIEPPDWTEDKQFEFLVPRNLQLEPGTELSLKVAQMIREFYFKNGIQKEDYINVLSDTFFLHGSYRTIREHVNNKNRKSSDYFYTFSYDGNRGMVKIVFKISDIKGTAHGDDLGYMFTADFLPIPIIKGDQDHEMIKTLTSLWVNFAKTGNPTKDLPVQWEKVQKDQLQYLDIGEQLTMKDDFPFERMKFWERVRQLVRDETRNKI